MDKQESTAKYFPTVGDGTGLAQTDSLYKEELQLALRNRGMSEMLVLALALSVYARRILTVTCSH
jgi:hypothetical protein